MPLTDAKLRTLTTPGKHFDGGGLYLELTKAGGRYWRLKYRHGGKENRLALGVYPDRAIAPKLIAVGFPGLSPCSRYPSQRGGAWFGYWPSGGWSRA